MRLYLVKILILLVVVEAALSHPEPRANGNIARKRKRKNSSKSTSSSDTRENSENSDSLELSTSSSSSSSRHKSERKKNKHRARSTEERTGWRKWHRKCTPCPEDMRKKWRDPSIEWICGAYQRARRSFKSKCMMHYRNCQDGTMFVKIHSDRCKNDTRTDLQKHGDHFFYDYKADLSDDSSSSDTSSSSSTDDEWKRNWHLA